MQVSAVTLLQTLGSFTKVPENFDKEPCRCLRKNIIQVHKVKYLHAGLMTMPIISHATEKEQLCLSQLLHTSSVIQIKNESV